MKTGIELIAEERQRQIEVEGWTIEHDKEYEYYELSRAAAAYVLPDSFKISYTSDDFSFTFKREDVFPFKENWKPTPDNRIRELQKAGALIAAEIDRLIALEETTS